MCTFWTLCSHVCEPNLSWKVLENEFLSRGKPWNLIFASPESPEKQYFTARTNPVN